MDVVLVAAALVLAVVAVGLSALALIAVSQTHALTEDERQHLPPTANHDEA